VGQNNYTAAESNQDHNTYDQAPTTSQDLTSTPLWHVCLLDSVNYCLYYFHLGKYYLSYLPFKESKSGGELGQMAKSKKRKGRDVLSRISSLQRPIRTTARRFELHPSSRFDGGKGGSERRLSHDQVSSEMSLLHALTWTALGRTMYIPLTSDEPPRTYRRV
jgi:hypothetical protein